jgi:predicted nucleic acid-binding protein
MALDDQVPVLIYGPGSSQPHIPRVAAETLERLSTEGVGVSIVTLGEVYEGAALAPNPVAAKARYRTLLAPFPVLLVSDSIMERFAELRGTLRRAGALIP